MKRMRMMVAAAGVAAALCINGGNLMAQAGGAGGGGQPGGGPPDRPNFDPAEMQRMMMDNLREQLEVKDDAEWSVLQAQLQKVMDARTQAGTGGGGRGMFGMMGPRGGQGGPDRGNAQGGNRRNGGPGGRGGPQTSAELTALRQAIDANAGSDDLKAAVTKLVESRKQKQGALEKAQDDLRKLLSVRQEAIAYSMGLL